MAQFHSIRRQEAEQLGATASEWGASPEWSAADPYGDEELPFPTDRHRGAPQQQEGNALQDFLSFATGSLSQAVTLVSLQAKSFRGGDFSFDTLQRRLGMCCSDDEGRIQHEVNESAPVSQYIYDDVPNPNTFPTILAQQEAGSKPPTPTGVNVGGYRTEHHWQPGGVLASLVGQGSHNDMDALMEYPEMEIEGGSRYAGQWLGTERHGRGVLTALDGHRFDGQFRNSMAHGRGFLVEADGSRYEGQWERDQKHGHGTYAHADGTTYLGQWSQDAKSGTGTEFWHDGAQYQGEFLYGLKHGVGIYKAGNGVEYEGQFREDKMDGEGCYKFAGGRKYFGQWEDGHMSGFGRMEWPNGAQYEGGYDSDMKSGEGTFVWPDGRRYTGQWLAGKQHGHGMSEDAEGRRTQDRWHLGELVPDPHQGAAVSGEESFEQESQE